MSIAPGRVGVAPSEVDLFGKLVGGGGSGGDSYTKAECDNKFLSKVDAAATYESSASAAATYETKANASATYETKTDAAATYETKANATATYETKANAVATYETISNASATYETKTDASIAYSGIRSDMDSWHTNTGTDGIVQSDNTVSFSGLNDIYAYDLYAEDNLIGITSLVKTGSGSNVTLTYTVSGATPGDELMLRIIK